MGLLALISVALIHSIQNLFTELNRKQDIRGHPVFLILQICCFLFVCFSYHTKFVILLNLFLSLQT